MASTTQHPASRAKHAGPLEEALFQALQSFAGRIAQSDDPKDHQAAGKQLQRNLQSLKNKGASRDGQSAP